MNITSAKVVSATVRKETLKVTSPMKSLDRLALNLSPNRIL
jgi:hypothetical protein